MEYLICLECDSPTYNFEEKEGKILEALCDTCGNDNKEEFMTEEEMEGMS